MKRTILLTFVVMTSCVKLPPSFKKCNRKDPDWQKCVIDAGMDGLRQLTKPFPEVRLPSLDPMEVTEISLKTTTGRIALDQNFKNIKVYGLNTVKVEQFEFDFDKKTVSVAGVIPEVKLSYEYKVKGSFFLSKLNGTGQGSATLHDLKFKGHMGYEEVKKKGKTFLNFVTADSEIEPGKASFDFGVDANKEWGQNLVEFVNKNWKLVYADLKEGYLETFRKIFLTLLNGFFSRVSVEEAFD